MPNRMIKETVRTSRQIGQLDDFAFRLWTYLITYVDDYGRGSADPELLKGFLFSRRKSTTEKNISDGLDKLASAGLVVLYEVDGEPFLSFPTWGKHQRIQSKVSKFPAPPKELLAAIGIDDNEDSSVAHGDSRKVTESHGNPPPETKPNQEETKPSINQVETNMKQNKAAGGGTEEEAQRAARLALLRKYTGEE